MRERLRTLVPALAVTAGGWLALGGCLADNPPLETDSGSAGTGDDSGGPPISEGGLLGCPAGQTCTALLVSQTLDDRLDLFFPEGPSPIYRGSVDLDLKPNAAGDNTEGRLDEPFGVALDGDFLTVLTGHFPDRTAGSSLAIPLSLLETLEPGTGLPVDRYFAAGRFSEGVVQRPLEQLEPIVLTPHRSGRLLGGVFANDLLFSPEIMWTEPGSLLVMDPDDPGGAVGVRRLDDLDGGSCNAPFSVVPLDDERVGIACDGNEAVAIMDISGLGGGTPEQDADGITGRLCDLPAAAERRVRYLAPDGAGGLVVADSATTLTPDNATVWHLDEACNVVGFATLEAGGAIWRLGEIVALPEADGTVNRWLLASGVGHRGVYVLHSPDGAALELCPAPLEIPDATWDSPAGGNPLDPFALALAADGAGIAVTAVPFSPPAAGPDYGKVLWGSLERNGDDPCNLDLSLTDLTDGSEGRAPAVNPNDPSTWRRAPSVAVVQSVAGPPG